MVGPVVPRACTQVGASKPARNHVVGVTSDRCARTEGGRLDTIRGMTGPASSSERTGRTGGLMTETREIDVIAEALSVIDRALAEIINRELVSSGEVADVLLDVRTLLTTQQPSGS